MSQHYEVVGTQNVEYDRADDENDGFYLTLGIAGVQSGNVAENDGKSFHIPQGLFFSRIQSFVKRIPDVDGVFEEKGHVD